MYNIHVINTVIKFKFNINIKIIAADFSKGKSLLSVQLLLQICIFLSTTCYWVYHSCYDVSSVPIKNKLHLFHSINYIPIIKFII